ncbi:MLO-like protein [Microbacterium sp. HM58-2]|nr:MLO-like protein [Microbacterium sp. HM58-2]
MDDMDRTPHPEDPAEGAAAGTPRGHRTPHAEEPAEGAAAGDHSGAPEDNPAHNTAPDGRSGEQADGAAGPDGAPLGGDETTAEQLESDNAVEDDTLRTLDPDDPPA